MLIYPAIDLLEGRCVRLRQGRFAEATVYSDDPVAVARGFVDRGAEALHIVDLEGARLGKARNLDWIYRIRETVPVPMQVGGGVRSFALAARLFKAGIERVVLGTAAAEDPRLLRKLLEAYAPDRVAAALDLRGGRLAIEGWETEAQRGLDDVLAELRSAGCRWVVCTDVARDGTLSGAGQEPAAAVMAQGFQVIVAGGVAGLEDITRIRAAGAAGCIIGSALYEGRLTLDAALEAARAD